MADEKEETTAAADVDVDVGEGAAATTEQKQQRRDGESSGEDDEDDDEDDEPTVHVWYEKCVVCSKPPGKLKGRKPLYNTWCSLACAEHWLAQGGEEAVKLLEKYTGDKKKKWKDKTFSRRETKLLERLELFKDLLKRQSQWNQKVFLMAAVVTLLMALLDFSFVFPPIDFVIYWGLVALVAAFVWPQPDELVAGEGTFGKLGKDKSKDDEDELDSELIAGQWVKKKSKKKGSKKGGGKTGKTPPSSPTKKKKASQKKDQ